MRISKKSFFQRNAFDVNIKLFSRYLNYSLLMLYKICLLCARLCKCNDPQRPMLSSPLIPTSIVPFLQKRKHPRDLEGSCLCIPFTLLFITAELLFHRHVLSKTLILLLAIFIKFIVCKYFYHLKPKLGFLLQP